MPGTVLGAQKNRVGGNVSQGDLSYFGGQRIFLDKGKFKQKPDEDWQKSIPGRGHSLCKGPEIGRSVATLTK